MRKHLLFITLVMLGMCMLPSCGSRPKTTSEVSKVKNDVSLKKSSLDSITTIKAGISENYIKNYTEELSYKTTVSEPQPIELTAVFKLDSSSSLKGDTALRLVSIDDNNISVVVYQNKKTNELTAKIKTKGKKAIDVPFSELQIKRTFNEQSTKTDTSSTATRVIKAQVDSTNQSQTTLKEFKDNDVLLSWIIAGGFLIASGLLAYFIFKPKTK